MSAKVLIVDDEADLELLIKQKFRKEIRAGELSFQYACNGLDALRVLNEHSDIDIVLTDLNMPEMDGLTLLTRIRHIKATLRTIVVSAYGDMGNIRAAMNLGAFDFVTKPIDFGDLKVTLNKTLESVKELREIEQARREKEEAQKMALEQERKAKLSQQKLIDHLKKMDRLKDEFLANTSHELKTPLNGIIGLVESLLDGVAGEQNEQTQQNLFMIANSGKRLTRLVDDILDFSKMRSGNITLNRQGLDFRDLCDLVFTLIKPLADEKKLELINRIPENLPLISADPNRTQQILFNLLGNAIKFTESGNVTVSAAVEENNLSVTISDTGIGIPNERLGDIFNMFEQLEESATRTRGGAGLGLAITKKLLELGGGSIEVDSIVGQGSRFTFKLPLAQEHEEKATIVTRKDVPQRTRKKTDIAMLLRDISGKDGQHILVVDDEPINQQVLLNHLSLQNFNITQAMNGPEALRKIENTNFDLVILDIMMPGMSGYEVCKTIRETHSLYDLPVLMLTAKNQMGDLTKGLEAGANDYLMKPFDKRELIARVHTLIALKDAVNVAIERKEKLAEEQLRSSQLQDQALTSAKAVLKANEATQQKSDLLAMMSHELRTPLNAIIGYSEILLEDLELDEHSGYIPDVLKIQSSAQNLLSLINNLLDLSKIEAGKMELYLETFKISTLLQEIGITIEPLISKHHNSFSVVQSDKDDTLSSDVTKLRIILTNLLGNACKFTRQGKVELIVTQEEEGWMNISVRDTGIGMTSDQQSRIFQPFTQAEKGTFRHHGGSGLGLMITRRFCEMIGGSIRVESELGKGSSFIVRIPKQSPTTVSFG